MKTSTITATAVALTVAAVIALGVTVACPDTAPAAEKPAPAPVATAKPAAVKVAPLVAAIVLNVDTSLDAGWKVQRAARIWNRALHCQLFTTVVPEDLTARRVYWLSEVAPGTLMLDGEYVRALHMGRAPGEVGSIEFDRRYGGVQASTTVHELGHAAGLGHIKEDPDSVMNVSTDQELPSARDIALALEIQTDLGRCAK